MSTIRERILARPDLQASRAARDIDALAAGLNTECVLTMIPARATLASIFETLEHTDAIFNLVQAVADGEPMQARAQALLSDEGIEVFVEGYVPPKVTRTEVNNAMFNPDGTEK